MHTLFWHSQLKGVLQPLKRFSTLTYQDLIWLPGVQFISGLILIYRQSFPIFPSDWKKDLRFSPSPKVSRSLSLIGMATNMIMSHVQRTLGYYNTLLRRTAILHISLQNVWKKPHVIGEVVITISSDSTHFFLPAP